jgi:hypothetical protein
MPRVVQNIGATVTGWGPGNRASALSSLFIRRRGLSNRPGRLQRDHILSLASLPHIVCALCAPLARPTFPHFGDGEVLLLLWACSPCRLWAAGVRAPCSNSRFLRRAFHHWKLARAFSSRWFGKERPAAQGPANGKAKAEALRFGCTVPLCLGT